MFAAILFCPVHAMPDNAPSSAFHSLLPLQRHVSQLEHVLTFRDSWKSSRLLGLGLYLLLCMHQLSAGESAWHGRNAQTPQSSLSVLFCMHDNHVCPIFALCESTPAERMCVDPVMQTAMCALATDAVCQLMA